MFFKDSLQISSFLFYCVSNFDMVNDIGTDIFAHLYIGAENGKSI